MRHTPPRGIIALVVEAEGNWLSIRVSDTSEGIAPEKLSRIRERFYQGEQQIQESGAGLGLTLVKEWIEGMGGSVAVESVIGQGSCFTLRVPCAGSIRLDERAYRLFSKGCGQPGYFQNL